MNTTDDIIAELSAKGAAEQSALWRFVSPLLLVCLFSVTALLAMLGEPFLTLPEHGPGPMAVKWGFSLPLVIGGAFALFALGHPGRRARARMMFLLLPFLAVGILLALDLTTPGQTLGQATTAATWSTCLTAMATLSPVAFGAAILATRWLAPVKLRKAGMAAGIFGGGVAMSAYSPFCPELGIVFMTLYYVLPVAAMAAIGWLAGPRLLRW